MFALCRYCNQRISLNVADPSCQPPCPSCGIEEPFSDPAGKLDPSGRLDPEDESVHAAQSHDPARRDRIDPDEIPMPASFRVERRPDGMRILRRWSRSAGAVMAVVSVVLGAASVGMFYGRPTVEFARQAGVNVSHDPMGMAVGGCAVMLAYAAFAYCINCTRIDVADGRIVIRNGPLPWIGDDDVRADRIRQLYVREQEKENTDDSVYRYYDLFAEFDDGRRDALIRELHERDHALFLEQELERHLGIENRRVPGEVAKPVRLSLASSGRG